MMDFCDLAESRICSRSFIDKAISNDDIMKMLNAAHRAPSAGNCQPWHFYVIKDKETLQKMYQNVYSAKWITSAALIIVVCVDSSQSEIRYGERGRTLYCIQDTAAAVQNILLSAEDLGLGACWVGDFSEIACSTVLKLPDNLRPIALITVGYTETKSFPTRRKPLNEIVTFIGNDECNEDLESKQGGKNDNE